MPSSETQFKPIHGMSMDSNGKRCHEYTAWRSMRQRCLNPKHKNFKDYGGRGITICKEWDSFQRFYEDMGKAPAGHTIERLNNQRGYDKKNCVWATSAQQANNRRSTRFVLAFGERKSISEWGRKFGIRPDTLTHRLDVRLMPPEQALTTPVCQKKSIRAQVRRVRETAQECA